TPPWDARTHAPGAAMFRLLLRPGSPPPTSGPPLAADCRRSSPPSPPPRRSSEKGSHRSQQSEKQFIKGCGAVGVSFHIGISSVSLAIYLSVSSGEDMTAVLCKLGFSESSLQSKRAAGTRTFLLAYAIHKLFAPVRIICVPAIQMAMFNNGETLHCSLPS
uniref:DUF1279 domain-containing protein n=1 Tax=Anas platyrhynchos platyrhynchos TaxID=8840 RepID=A0A493SUI3_ANAPP